MEEDKEVKIKEEHIKDWYHKILTHLYKNESVFHVHLNANGFLTNTLGIGENDGNKGRKLVIRLQHLSEIGLIKWRWSDHNNEQNIPFDYDNETDNASITLSVYWFHAELTLKGIDYVENYLRLKGQDQIEKQNRNLTRLNILIAILTGGFIALTAIDAHNDTTSKELRTIDSTLQDLIKQKKLIQPSSQIYQDTIHMVKIVGVSKIAAK